MTVCSSRGVCMFIFPKWRQRASRNSNSRGPPAALGGRSHLSVSPAAAASLQLRPRSFASPGARRDFAPASPFALPDCQRTRASLQMSMDRLGFLFCETLVFIFYPVFCGAVCLLLTDRFVGLIYLLTNP